MDRTSFADMGVMPRFDGQASTTGFPPYFDQLEPSKELWSDVYSWPWVDPSGSASLKGFPQCLSQDIDTCISRTESLTSSSEPTYSDATNSQTPGSPASDVVVIADSRKRRRQEQNRAAQRALRDRKEKTLVELQEKVAALNNEASNLREDNQQLQDSLMEARKEVATLKSLLSVPSISTPGSPQQRQTLNLSLGKASRSFILKIDVDGQGCDYTPKEPGVQSPMSPISLR